jgi:hypothetical protein
MDNSQKLRTAKYVCRTFDLGYQQTCSEVNSSSTAFQPSPRKRRNLWKNIKLTPLQNGEYNATQADEESWDVHDILHTRIKVLF